MNRTVRWYLAGLSLALLTCVVPSLERGFTITLKPALVQLALASMLALIAWVYARIRHAPSIAVAAETAFWATVISTAFTFPMHLLIRSGVPLSDAVLARADRLLGLNVWRLSGWAQAHGLSAALGTIYFSLRPVSIAALLLPGFARRAEWASELLLAMAISAAASLLILSQVQAIGPWVGGHFAPDATQAACESSIRALKAGSPVVINLAEVAPLIAFPSWHVILALLSARTIARVRLLRWPAIVWATLLVISTVGTRWHYAVDSLAGVVLALLSLLASSRLHQVWRPRRCPESVELTDSGSKQLPTIA